MGESRNAYRVVVGRPEGKRPVGRPRRRWEDNIKMDLREIGYDDIEWINLAQDRELRLVLLPLNLATALAKLLHGARANSNFPTGTVSVDRYDDDDDDDDDNDNDDNDDEIRGLRTALAKVKDLDIAAETLIDMNGTETYLTKFTCIVMSSMWMKVLSEINHWNSVLQARKATTDVKVENIKALIQNLKTLLTKWDMILQECVLVTANIGVPQNFPEKRKVRRSSQEVYDNDILKELFNVTFSTFSWTVPLGTYQSITKLFLQ
ncbi:hypothetical protein ANN_06834 [Periplaneta americana]|uniref:Uncharacterized protein n=1 Tax=Periplaneta americana TaxID=6978 RepID=A0ABQ8TH54_PERAM|nr:hypothetical protein ANN_06834 [Periplaneta americana]